MTGLRFALVGKRLGHSFSKKYFDSKFEMSGLDKYSYTLLEMPDLSDLTNIVSRCRLDGFNVTIPYKRDILPLLDSLDPTAEDIGAVNTVAVCHTASGIAMRGYNTDAPAFEQTLRPLITHQHRKALVLGTGGAAQAVAWGLKKLNIDFVFVSRHPELHTLSIGYDTLLRLNRDDFDYQIIINATPVGMFPDIDSTPWCRPDLLTSGHICYDLTYNPSPTRFLKEAAAHGATIVGGLEMLHRQADLAFEIWTHTSTSNFQSSK